MGLAYAHGISSSIRDAGHRLTSLVSTSVIHASGSTQFNLQVSMSDAAIAQFCAPMSWPAKSAFFLVRAIGLMARSTVLESNSHTTMVRRGEPRAVVESRDGIG